jgi:hypothetical protein
MAERGSPGQVDKAAAEQRTAQVGAERQDTTPPTSDAAASRAAGRERTEEIRKQNDPKESGDPNRIKLGEGADAEAAHERVAASEDPTSPLSPEVVDPYPAYEAKSLEDLRALAQSRGAEINRDVEKAHLVYKLREKDGSPVYDLMPLEVLRDKAKELDVGLDPEFEVAHLVTELRAVDTHVGPSQGSR